MTRRRAFISFCAVLAFTAGACWPQRPPLDTWPTPHKNSRPVDIGGPYCMRYPDGCDADPAPDEPVSCEDHPEPYEGDLPCGFVDGIPVGADG